MRIDRYTEGIMGLPVAVVYSTRLRSVFAVLRAGDRRRSPAVP